MQLAVSPPVGMPSIAPAPAMAPAPAPPADRFKLGETLQRVNDRTFKDPARGTVTELTLRTLRLGGPAGPDRTYASVADAFNAARLITAGAKVPGVAVYDAGSGKFALRQATRSDQVIQRWVDAKSGKHHERREVKDFAAFAPEHVPYDPKGNPARVLQPKLVGLVDGDWAMAARPVGNGGALHLVPYEWVG